MADRLDVLLKEYEGLLEKDRHLTSFYHQYSTVGATAIGVVFYYAYSSCEHQFVFLAVPLLICLLALFLEFWRVDSAMVAAHLCQIGERMREPSHNGQEKETKRNHLLVSTSTTLDKGLFIVHKASGKKLFNPMWLFVWAFFFALLWITIVSFWNAYEWFENNGYGWQRVAYLALTGGLTVATIFVLWMFEGRKRLERFCREVTGLMWQN
ncbi:MAG TPA: hypothetical protein VN285_10740 [Candidatus Deferrimicrobium sp.]|nr:hypothetical protein [Candidatus Deferrimicrobium sp.]